MGSKGLRFRIVKMVILGGLILPACALTQGQSLPTETPMLATTVIQESLPTATETEPPVTLELPTAEANPVQTAVAMVVEQKTLVDEGEDPKYTVKVNYPFIAGMEDFNQSSQSIAKRIADAFLENLAAYPVTTDPSIMSYSSVNMDFTVMDNTSEVISVYFEISEYYSGAAHPNPFSAVLNYDVRNQKVLAQSDLFQPGADYLALLSDYAMIELTSKEEVTFPEGALPEAENFQIWNLTPDGLLITFDPYLVASYAAGFIQVVVPNDVLMEIANPDGVLAGR